jgi:hypothetical protein
VDPFEREQRRELIREAHRRLQARLSVRAATDSSVALQLAQAVADGAAGDLAKELIGAISPALPAALALALRDPDEEVPIERVAAELKLTVNGTLAAARGGRLPLALVKGPRGLHCRRADLEELLGATPAPSRDALVRLLTDAIRAILPEARRAAEELPALVTAQELAEELGAPARRVFGKLEAGTLGIAPVRFGARLRFRRADVEKLTARKSSVPKAGRQTAGRAAAASSAGRGGAARGGESGRRGSGNEGVSTPPENETAPG